MRIVIPMAGRGSRMRPHTLTTPKPLIPVAGKPIVQRLCEDIAASTSQSIEEIAFIIGRSFGEQVEADLKAIADSLGARGVICYQDEPLGTAHAVLCAKESLTGPVIIAFADTLFKADFDLDLDQDGTIWVKKIDDPSAFGVVKLDENNHITDFVEKPETFVSDLAIIGVYFVKEGETIRDEMQYLIDNDVKDKGEYQLTNALENMKAKGAKFTAGAVEEWLDCGNKDATVYTNQRILELKKEEEKLVSDDLVLENAQLIQPCYVGKSVKIVNAIVGPHVSIGEGSTISESVVSNTIVGDNTSIENRIIGNSMIGNNAKVGGRKEDLSISDYSTTS